MTKLSLSDLKDKGTGYLASPYSKYPSGIYNAFSDICEIGGRLIKAGLLHFYSPIAHTHPIAIYGQINPYDHTIWLPFDQPHMDRSDYLLIAMMPTWDKSYGIGKEIVIFGEAGKPVYYLDPSTLEVYDEAPPEFFADFKQPEEPGSQEEDKAGASA